MKHLRGPTRENVSKQKLSHKSISIVNNYFMQPEGKTSSDCQNVTRCSFNKQKQGPQNLYPQVKLSPSLLYRKNLVMASKEASLKIVSYVTVIMTMLTATVWMSGKVYWRSNNSDVLLVVRQTFAFPFNYKTAIAKKTNGRFCS